MEKQKLTKRQIQAQNTQKHVYKTAVELMKKNGFDNITVQQICNKANVSVGTFYNCFKSKNDILEEIFKLADDYFYNVVANKLKQRNTVDKIIQFFRYYATYNMSDGIDLSKQLYTTKNKLFITKGRYMQTILQNIIEEGQQKGEIHTNMTPEEIVEFLFISVRGVVYDWCLHDGQYDLEAFVVKYVKRLIKILN